MINVQKINAPLFLGTLTLFFILCALIPRQAWATPAHNHTEEKWVMAEATKLKNKEMAEIRAGFIDPSGFILRFAVDVKTQIDGALAYVRSLVLEPNSFKGFNATSSTQILPQNLTNGDTASSVNEGTGTVITGKNGTTTVLTESANGTLANIILNTADNRVVSQTMNIDLILQDVGAIFGPMASLRGANLPAGLINQTTRMHSVGFGF